MDFRGIRRRTIMESFFSNPVPRRQCCYHIPPVFGLRLGYLRQDILLLCRLHSSFYVLGMTGNVYTVTISASPSCNCPIPSAPCKHILFVFLRVLRLSLDDPVLHQRTLSLPQIHRVLDRPTSPEVFASAAICQRFHQMFFRPKIEVEDGTSCPICLEEIKKEEKLVACETCRNPIHRQCFLKWKRSQENKILSCVICRAPWLNKNEEDDDPHHTDRYLNLSSYVIQEYRDEAQPIG